MDILDTLAEVVGPITQLVAAVVGVVAVLLGLVMAKQAFDDARASKPKQENGVITVDGVEVGAAPGVAGAASLTVPSDFFKVLPELVKTAAGIAVVTLLVGTFLLLGASFAQDAGSGGASPSPGATATPGPS